MLASCQAHLRAEQRCACCRSPIAFGRWGMSSGGRRTAHSGGDGSWPTPCGGGICRPPAAAGGAHRSQRGLAPRAFHAAVAGAAAPGRAPHTLSTRSLRHCMTAPVRVGRTRGRHWIVAGLLLVLAGLSAWGVLARVPVYMVARHTPLTLDQALQVVMTPVIGQVRVTHLQVGREVEAGDILVALDSTAQRLQLEEAQQHLGALEAHRTARRQEGAALEAAWQATAQAAQATQAEAQSRHDDAVRALQVAQEKVQRLGLLSPLADLQAQKTAVETTHRSLQQLAYAQQVQAAEWGARLAQHQREVVVLEGDLVVAKARLA